MLHNMRVLAVGDHFFIISKQHKTSCFKSRHFINIYIINRTLHGRLGIRILSSRAESISHSFASLTRERYLQRSKIKFVSPRGHVISSMNFNVQKYIVFVFAFALGSLNPLFDDGEFRSRHDQRAFQYLEMCLVFLQLSQRFSLKHTKLV